MGRGGCSESIRNTKELTKRVLSPCIHSLFGEEVLHALWWWGQSKSREESADRTWPAFIRGEGAEEVLHTRAREGCHLSLPLRSAPFPSRRLSMFHFVKTIHALPVGAYATTWTGGRVLESTNSCQTLHNRTLNNLNFTDFAIVTYFRRWLEGE